MNLMTKELEEKLLKKPLYSTDGEGLDAECVVKYFNPISMGDWLICEGEKQPDGDWLLYGLCHLFEWEWGFVRLSDLENVKLPGGLKIERDLYSSGTVGELAKELGYGETQYSSDEIELNLYEEER